MSDTNTVAKMTMAELTALVIAQGETIKELQSKVPAPKNTSQREMTDDDAKRILTGDLAKVKHKDAASTLGLSYGQVYSCRLEFTFKNVHKAMKDAKIANPWVK